MSTDRRTLLALFAIAFGVRILYAVLVGSNPDVNTSPITYDYLIAERIHDNTSWLSQPFTPAAPGYIVSLAAVFRLSGPGWWFAVVFNALLASLTVLMLYRIGEKHLGKGVGLLSALWLCVYVHQVHYASIILRDTLTTFAVTWFCYAIARRSSHMRWGIWLGLIYTVIIYVEPMFLLAAPLVMVFLLLRATRHRLLNLQYFFLFIATVFVLNIPWTLRNYSVYGEFVPISFEATRYTAPITNLIWRGTNERSVPPEFREPSPGFLHNSIEFWRVTRLSAHEADPERGIRGEPAWSLRHNAISFLSYGLLLPLCLLGVFVAIRQRQRTALFLASAALLYYAMSAWLGTGERTRLPVEPLLLLLAFYGLLHLIQALRKTQPDDGQPA